MGAFYFDGLFLHDDEAIAFIRKYLDSDDADARYVARRLVDTCPRIKTDAENIYIIDEPATVRKFAVPQTSP